MFPCAPPPVPAGLLTQPIFVEHLLGTRHCSPHGGSMEGRCSAPCFSGGKILAGETDNEQENKYVVRE